MADFGGNELEAFRKEVRDWLEANYPASLRQNGAEFDAVEAANPTGDADLWRKRMGEKGWGTPTWPKEYGGGGLTQAQARVLAEEMRRIGAPNPITGMGPGMFGSTLLEYGTEAQKQKYLPPIVRGDVRWCQGFSEPGAGSDLASLSTKAEDMGDHFLINGQKIWTSGAQYADMCFCLCRTDPKAKKHEGISFILIDMHQPGVEARPIKMISGASGQCETFFTNATAPKENLVGQLNAGWGIAKRLLQHERNGMGSRSGEPAREVVDLADIAKEYVGVDDAGRLADADLRTRLTLFKMEDHAFRQTVRRVAAEARGNNSPSAATSIMKNVSMKLWQDRAEMTVEIMGGRGLGWEGDDFSPEELAIVRDWLAGKAGSIFGGSAEIQNNIITKRILGLPELTGQG
jgi:alkylation response protein AidB-like acyl-CoA dehydrogenase